MNYNYKYIDILNDVSYNIFGGDDMKFNATFFSNPTTQWQRQYEALRASFIDRLPAEAVANKYGYTAAYVRLMRHKFMKGQLFIEPVEEGKAHRRKVTREIREKIIGFRHQDLSGSEIAELLLEEGTELSIRTVERVLDEEGFLKLKRRIRRKIGITVKGAKIPERSQQMMIDSSTNQTIESDYAGLFLLMPFIQKLGIQEVIKKAGLPGTKAISAMNYFLSFLSLKLIGNERYSHMSNYGFDQGLGLFAGLNILPKCTAMSTYSYSLDAAHIQRLQEAFIRQSKKLGLWDANLINLDFHTIPHFGEESVLQKHWAGARNKVMKGALTVFAQDLESRLMLYSDADIKRQEMSDAVLDFVRFWDKSRPRDNATLIFDSKFTSYTNLSKLNEKGIKFITLRRRGKGLIESTEKASNWKTITVLSDKRKYPNPEASESQIQLKGYHGNLRQIIIRNHGRENPTFMITNDFDLPVDTIVSHYAKRWRIENGISEMVSFFNLNMLSSPILTKIHFDVALTTIADTIYHMFAKQCRGFEDCHAKTIFRHFIEQKGTINISNNTISIHFREKAHNPILRAIPWQKLPDDLMTFDGMKLNFKFG